MVYRIMDSRIGAQPIADLSTTKKHDLGEIIKAVDPSYGAGEFIYLSGASSMAVRNWVTYDLDSGAAVRVVAGAIGPVAVAMAAVTASYYGWFQIHGKAVGTCLTQLADNGSVWLCGTTGAVDDQSLIGDWVHNAKTASNPADDILYADFEIARPWCDSLSAQT